MASPSDSARQATNITTAAGTWAVNVGSPAAGTLLIVFIRSAAASGGATFAGYTPLVDNDSSDASDDSTFVYYRWADGSEGATDTWDPVNSVKGGAVGYEITGAANPLVQPPVISAPAVGTTAANSCDAPAFNPISVNQDLLILALGGADGEVAFTGAPASYANLQAANSGTTGGTATNCFMGGASRALTGTGDNPGVFTHGAATNGWTAYTVVIFPSTYVRPFSGPSVENLNAVRRASTW